MITVTVEDRHSQSGQREEQHASATTWSVDDHDGLHVRDAEGDVASYAPTRWIRVAKSDS